MLSHYLLVVLFLRNHTAHAALWVWHIALVSWDDMHVTMEDRLPRSLTNIDSDVVTIGVKTFVNLLHNIFLHHIHRLLFVVRQIAIGCNVPFGNYQRMTRRYRITIVEGNTSSRLTDDFHISGKIAKMASYPIFPWQFVEVVILIEFIAFISNEALVWQFDIALISPLLMNGMKSEAFFGQVTTHRKIGCTLGREQIGDAH